MFKSLNLSPTPPPFLYLSQPDNMFVCLSRESFISLLMFQIRYERKKRQNRLFGNLSSSSSSSPGSLSHETGIYQWYTLMMFLSRYHKARSIATSYRGSINKVSSSFLFRQQLTGHNHSGSTVHVPLAVSQLLC